MVVCNPRKNALLKSGNKSDQIDARKLAELLRAGMLSPVYHGEQSTRTLQQLVAGYTALTEDTGRAMRRIKALYRSQAIACAGKKPFGKRHRGEWVARLRQRVARACGMALPGVGRRADLGGKPASGDGGVPRIVAKFPRSTPFLGPRERRCRSRGCRRRTASDQTLV